MTWISVEDALPEPGSMVEVEPGYRLYYHPTERMKWARWNCYRYVPVGGVTQWRPLSPAKPTRPDCAYYVEGRRSDGLPDAVCRWNWLEHCEYGAEWCDYKGGL